MKYAPLMMAFLILSGGALGQKVAGSSSISILEHKWKANVQNRAVADSDPFAANDAARKSARAQKDTNIENAQRQSRGENVLVPAPRRDVSSDSSSTRQSRITYTYQIKVENMGPKSVSEITWEYAFVDSGTGNTLGSRTFQTKTDLKPNERDSLVERSGFVPPLSAQSKSIERITVKSVRYSDGTVWTANPS